MSFLKNKILSNVSLFAYNTFGTGGKAKYFIMPETEEELFFAIDFAKENGLNYFILGNGSKLLVADSGFDGLVVCTTKLNKIFTTKNGVYAQAGVRIKNLIDYSFKNGFGGLEFLVGVPATVGGLIKMNAGAFGKEVCNFVNLVTVYNDYQKFDLHNEQCGFSYRKSDINGVILGAEFLLDKSDRTEENCKYFRLKRQCMQPSGKSAGSVFKNPNGVSAGFLIEKAGLKGFSINSAYVSPKHANFIINGKNATSNEIYTLIQIVKEKVKNSFGVELVEEIVYLGEFNFVTDSRLSHPYDVQPRKR